jgi:protein-S-isoprenylcysteine O-methyltransferase Ste14
VALRALVAVAGGLVFAVSLAVGALAYVRWFVADAGRWSIAAAAPAIAIDTLLFSGFALHHSVFARTPVRRWVGRAISPALERSAYVWVASVLFILICRAWQPVPGLAWHVDRPWAWGLTAFQLTGLWLTLDGARRLDIWELAGVRQALGRERPGPAALVRTGGYGLVRHPIYLGWLLMVWPAATMTGTRMTFAAVSTAYLVLAIPFEERTLRREFGAEYDAYARAIRWRMAPFVY